MRSNKECEYIITLKAGKKKSQFYPCSDTSKATIICSGNGTWENAQKVKLDNTCKKRKKEHNETVGY